MKTLFDEVSEALKKHNKTFDDIKYIAVEDIMMVMTVPTFIKKAKEIELTQENEKDLVEPIILKGKDWIMERNSFAKADKDIWCFEKYKDEEYEDDPEVELLNSNKYIC